MAAVRFEQVSKRFTLHHERARTFQEAALNLVRRRNGTREAFWALRDVSFALERGRTLGVVGRNGSGKSTLLKLLAGTMRPTSGTVAADGRIFGLLELAAGFHPDLSGRENVFLNGAFLGLSRAEMAARLDDIIAFAEIERFIDTPVKHYSSGMYMRLGFAIAISVDPDILVIDEVLAVGDAAFRQKCFAALARLKERNKTILFVTHDASAVRRFCDEALWLDAGRVRAAGSAEAVLKEYLAETAATHGEALVFAGRPPDPLAAGNGPLTLVGVETLAADSRRERHFESGERAGVRIRYRASEPLERVAFGVGLHRADGLYVWGTTSAAGGQRRIDAGDGEVVCWLPGLPLAAAEYTVSAAAWIDGAPVHRLSRATTFAVRPPHPHQAGLLVLAPQWTAGVAHASRRPIAAAAATDRSDSAGSGRVDGPGTIGAGDRPAGRRSNGAGPVDGYRPGRADDQLAGEEAFRFRWRPAPARLTMGHGEDEFLGSGWYAPEEWPPVVRWTGVRAAAYLTQDVWTTSVGVTLCRPQHGPEVVTGRVVVAGAVAGTFEMASPGLEPLTFPVEPCEETREVEVAIEIDNPLLPAPGDADQRVLGVAVHELWLE